MMGIEEKFCCGLISYINKVFQGRNLLVLYKLDGISH